MHWRPNPSDPDPDMPGEKMSIASFIPTGINAMCLCGSGKVYGECCRRQRYWHPICPNPGLQGYSLVSLPSATFKNVDDAVIRERLTADVRLQCIEDSPERGFWVYWGDPALDDAHGTLCFGDIELKQNHTLSATAMSDTRMRVLLDLLDEIASDILTPPHMRHDKVEVIDKVSGKRKKMKVSDHR
jgi:hypothetical protein